MIKDNNYCVEFKNQKELEKLVDIFKFKDCGYGTTNDDLNDIKYLGVRYFGIDNRYLSVDASRKKYYKPYVSCGKGRDYIVYTYEEFIEDFKDDVLDLI